MPFFTSVELSGLEKACRGNTFAQRRDAAVIAVFRASGIRLSELAGIRCGDLDLETREIKVFGKGRKERIVKIDYEAARSPASASTSFLVVPKLVGDRPGRDLAGRRQRGQDGTDLECRRRSPRHRRPPRPGVRGGDRPGRDLAGHHQLGQDGTDLERRKRPTATVISVKVAFLCAIKIFLDEGTNQIQRVVMARQLLKGLLSRSGLGFSNPSRVKRAVRSTSLMACPRVLIVRFMPVISRRFRTPC